MLEGFLFHGGNAFGTLFGAICLFAVAFFTETGPESAAASRHRSVSVSPRCQKFVVGRSVAHSVTRMRRQSERRLRQFGQKGQISQRIGLIGILEFTSI